MTTMVDEAILTRWIEQRSTIALQKLLQNEPLTFEDNVIFGLAGQREELRRLEQRIHERFEQQDKRFEQIERRLERAEDSIEHLRRELNETRKEILVYTRWTLTVIIAVPVVTKIVEALLAKLL